jgi:hypothetical protein
VLIELRVSLVVHPEEVDGSAVRVGAGGITREIARERNNP